jgi:hypothetical protein
MTEKRTKPASPSGDFPPGAAGRPKGARTGDRPTARYVPAQCPSCQSSRRAPFRDGPVFDERIPIEIDGRPYNRELWRDTCCLDCGQHYRVIEYRYEPALPPPRVETAISQETDGDAAPEQPK